ncbi:MAG: hypothetical protein ACP5U1_03915 [Desulfomonilaceae bacterium]
MKRLSTVFIGLVAGLLLLLGGNVLSVASETTTSKISATASSKLGDEQVAYRTHYRPYCYKVKRCVRINRFGHCIRWKWIRVCPGWRG